MTRQVDDLVFLNDQRFFLAGASPVTVFDPSAYGIAPRSMSTACYRGFACVYRVQERVLHLERLGVASATREYPQINGKDSEEDPGGSPTNWCNGRAYVFPEFRLSFSGTLRIGRGCVETSVGMDMMGFSDDTEYEELLDLSFDHGVLVATRDLTKKIARVRVQHEHVADLMNRTMLTTEELRDLYASHGLPRTIFVECSFILELREPDPGLLGAKIEAVERAIPTPRHFVSVLRSMYKSWGSISDFFGRATFVRHRVPEPLLDKLDNFVKCGMEERTVYACLVHALLSSGVCGEPRDMVQHVADWIVRQGKINEEERRVIGGLLVGITPEQWPDGGSRIEDP